MDDADIFHEFTTAEGFGPPLVAARLPPGAAAVFDRGAERAAAVIRAARARRPRLPAVHFAWIDSPDVNALAFRHRDRYFVGLNAGTLVLLNLVFGRMLGHPEVLTAVGDPAAESAGPPLAGLGTDARFVTSPDHRVTVPVDATRRRYCLHLRDEAVAFLAAHALAHVSHGHVDRAAAVHGRPVVAERGRAAATPDPPLTCQSLELDADRGAMAAVLGEIRDRRTAPAGEVHSDRQPIRAVFDAAFAVYTVFRLFGADAPGVELAAARSPPFRVRQLNAAGAATAYVLDEWDAAIVHPCAKAGADALDEVERAFARLTGEAPAVAGLQLTRGGAAWAHVGGRLRTHWANEVRPELLPFAHGELPD